METSFVGARTKRHRDREDLGERRNSGSNDQQTDDLAHDHAPSMRVAKQQGAERAAGELTGNHGDEGDEDEEPGERCADGECLCGAAARSELGKVVPPCRELAMPLDFADANTVRVATTANSSEPAIAIRNVRRRTSRMQFGLDDPLIVHLPARV